jgi:hypothetical protein
MLLNLSAAADASGLKLLGKKTTQLQQLAIPSNPLSISEWWEYHLIISTYGRLISSSLLMLFYLNNQTPNFFFAMKRNLIRKLTL